MELKGYIDLLRHRKWSIVTCVLIVTVVAGVLSALRSNVYESSARILLRPNDPTEALETSRQLSSQEADRFVQSQLDVLEGSPVAQAAADLLGRPDDVDYLDDHTSVRQVGVSDVIEVTTSDGDPTQAAEIANAFVDAYIENRRVNAVGRLEKASEELEVQLAELEAQIADYDRLIGDEGLSVGGTNTVTSPDVAIEPLDPNLSGVEAPDSDTGTPATTNESLKAARYAAAVQYQALFSKLSDLRVEINLKSGGAEVVDAAEPSGAPASPKPRRDAMLGAFLGLVLGIGVALVREQLDDRVRSREELEALTNQPVIGELPLEDRWEERPGAIASLEQPGGKVAERTRGLRTSLQFLGVDHPVTRVMVTSAGQGDGKTFVSSNLATVYGMGGVTTVVVSADLRRPRIDEVFDYPNVQDGLSDLLVRLSTSDPDEWLATAGPDGSRHQELVTLVRGYLVTTHVPNVLLLPAGSPPPNPAELIGSALMTKVLEALNDIASFVVIDSPPVLAVTDAVALAPHTDGVLLVASVGDTQRQAVQRAAESLHRTGARLLGVVANRVEAGRSYGYYTDYAYGYRAEETDGRGRKRRKLGSRTGEPASLDA